jgi:hypothetical protein
MNIMWSNVRWQSKQKATLALLLAPTSKGKKVSKKASEKAPVKKSSEKRRLPRRPRKARLWPMHQP